MAKSFKQLGHGALGFVLSLLSFACASTSPYISNESGRELDLVLSPKHKFTYVKVYEKGKELFLDCKLDHPQGFFQAERHVDLAVLDSRGAVLLAESLPVVSHGGRRQRWQKASFRTRLPAEAVQGSKILLTFR